MEQNHWAIWAARIYLIILLAINLFALIWANYMSFQIEHSCNNSVYQQTTTQENTISDNTRDYFPRIIEDAKESLRPITQAGEAAETATPQFIIGIFASLFTIIFMILPKYCMDSIKVHLPIINMDFESIAKFFWTILTCNIIAFIFDLIGASGYWDFAKAIIG